MKYIKEYLNSEEDNVKTLIDILEDLELDFQYRICPVKKILNSLDQTNRYLYYDNRTILKYLPTYQGDSSEMKDVDFSVVRVEINITMNKEPFKNRFLSGILSMTDEPLLNKWIAHNPRKSIMVKLKYLRYNSLFKRIQNLSEMTLIRVERIETDNLNQFLILDFTHSNNMLNDYREHFP